MDIKIGTGTIEEVVEAMKSMPEFDAPYALSRYHERIRDNDHLVLVAREESQLAGFKVGYDKYKDGSFYSWIGGIFPSYRRMGLASLLADNQEEYARKNGYRSIKVKTRNKFTGMLIFSLKRGFHIFDLETQANPLENRIHLVKML